jgi:hypothetical protein
MGFSRSFKEAKLRENKYGKFCPHCYSADTIYLPLGEAQAILMRYLPKSRAKATFTAIKKYSSNLPDSQIYLCLENGCNEVFKVTKV